VDAATLHPLRGGRDIGNHSLHALVTAWIMQQHDCAEIDRYRGGTCHFAASSPTTHYGDSKKQGIFP